MSISSKIVTCLWYNGQAEEASSFYVDLFNNAPSASKPDAPKSELRSTTRYPDNLPKSGPMANIEPGSVMTVSFTLAGTSFVALNGGPMYSFTPAVSMQIMCDGQEEVDYFFDKVVKSGEGKEGHQGWCTDRFGLSWQILLKRAC